MTKVLIMAGGTGGHVFPALAVADYLRAENVDVFWLGTQRGIEARCVPAAKIPIDWISVAGLRGKNPLAKIKSLWLLIVAFYQAWRAVSKRKPDVVLGMGGFVSGPGGIVAKLQRIPLVIHEQNRVVGTTNRLLARFANVILEAFPGSFSDDLAAHYSGNPLRTQFVDPGPPAPRRDASSTRVLIVGGSQGAGILNQLAPEAIASLAQSIEIRHQSGEPGYPETRSRYEALKLDAEVFPFIDDMAAAYQWADIVICRAGAMTISELAACGKASILIPLPHAIDDHQTANARYLADAGGATLLPESELSVPSLKAAISQLLDHPERLQAMSRAASRLAKLDAAETIAAICLEQVKT